MKGTGWNGPFVKEKNERLAERLELLEALVKKMSTTESTQYRSGTVNSNTVNSKFHLIQSFCEIFARFLSFHV